VARRDEQCVEVDPVRQALPLEEVDEILRRQVAGSARRIEAGSAILTHWTPPGKKRP
jgi:hypothetical protein